MHEDYPIPQRQVLKRRSSAGRAVLGGVLLTLLVIGGATGWLVFKGQLQVDPELQQIMVKRDAPQRIASVPGPAAQATSAAAASQFETRLAAMEARLARLDVAADTASSNAARAEGLLVAFATRRAIERGLSLGYLEPQLKLRFGDAQPAAVALLIEAGQKPVTRDQLLTQLDALAPNLENKPANASGWERVQRELANLFVVRRDDHPAPRVSDRLDRARLMLQAGRVEAAAEEVSGLPGAAAASTWLAAVRRYAGAQRALDAIESAALLEPHGLQDAKGREVADPSPLASPVPEATPAAAPAGSPKSPAPRP